MGAGINRIVEHFIKLSGFDSESFHEREIAEYIIGKYLEEPAGGIYVPVGSRSLL